MTDVEKVNKVDDYLRRAATSKINNELTNIKKGLAMVLLKVPEKVLEDLMGQGAPVIIIEAQPCASAIGYYREQGLDFQEGVRILTIEERVNNFPLRVIIGILAHEFAHLYLHCKPGVELDPSSELEAEELAGKWGFGTYLEEGRKFG